MKETNNKTLPQDPIPYFVKKTLPVLNQSLLRQQIPDIAVRTLPWKEYQIHFLNLNHSFCKEIM